MKKINFALLAGGIALVLLFFASAVYALPLHSSSDSVTIRDSTEARVVIWFENQAAEARAYSVQADAGVLYAQLDSEIGEVAGRSSKAVVLGLSSAPCLEGTFRVPVTVIISSANGVQERGSTSVQVQVVPSSQCASYSHGYDNSNIYNGEHLYFDPSEYSLKINSRSDYLKMEPTLMRRVPLEISNYGATGTFDIRVIGDVDELRPFLSLEKITLDRSEAKNVYFDVHSQKLPEGQYHLFVQVLNNRQVVAQKSFTFNVAASSATVPYAAATVSVPQQDADGSLMRLVATITNTGSDILPLVTATIAGIPNTWDVLSPAPIDVQPGETKAITVYLRQNTDEGAETPLLVLSSAGEKLYEKKLPAIAPRKQVGVTGLFAGVLSQDGLIVLLIIGIAVGIALWASNTRTEDEDVTSYYRKNAYQLKLKQIRDDAGAPAPDGF